MDVVTGELAKEPIHKESFTHNADIDIGGCYGTGRL